jgi:hypothetical protein
VYYRGAWLVRHGMPMYGVQSLLRHEKALRRAIAILRASPPKSRHRVVDPRQIDTLHKVKRKRDLRLLVGAMRDIGWFGRPALVESLGQGRYQAWTATHRIAAAKRVGIRVPIFLIDLKKWIRYWGPILTCAVDTVDEDEEKWEVLYRAGDKRAADLMRQEVELNMSGTAQGFV